LKKKRRKENRSAATERKKQGRGKDPVASGEKKKTQMGKKNLWDRPLGRKLLGVHNLLRERGSALHPEGERQHQDNGGNEFERQKKTTGGGNAEVRTH